MTEIAAVPANGLRAVSTFSGCGGSCLGYRMAGFQVLWANEFIPAAAEVYWANHPDTILDTRDNRGNRVKAVSAGAAKGIPEVARRWLREWEGTSVTVDMVRTKFLLDTEVRPTL